MNFENNINKQQITPNKSLLDQIIEPVVASTQVIFSQNASQTAQHNLEKDLNESRSNNPEATEPSQQQASQIVIDDYSCRVTSGNAANSSSDSNIPPIRYKMHHNSSINYKLQNKKGQKPSEKSTVRQQDLSIQNNNHIKSKSQIPSKFLVNGSKVDQIVDTHTSLSPKRNNQIQRETSSGMGNKDIESQVDQKSISSQTDAEKQELPPSKNQPKFVLPQVHVSSGQKAETLQSLRSQYETVKSQMNFKPLISGTRLSIPVKKVDVLPTDESCDLIVENSMKKPIVAVPERANVLQVEKTAISQQKLIMGYKVSRLNKSIYSDGQKHIKSGTNSHASSLSSHKIGDQSNVYGLKMGQNSIQNSQFVGNIKINQQQQVFQNRQVSQIMNHQSLPYFDPQVQRLLVNPKIAPSSGLSKSHLDVKVSIDSYKDANETNYSRFSVSFENIDKSLSKSKSRDESKGQINTKLQKKISSNNVNLLPPSSASNIKKNGIEGDTLEVPAAVKSHLLTGNSSNFSNLTSSKLMGGGGSGKMAKTSSQYSKLRDCASSQGVAGAGITGDGVGADHLCYLAPINLSIDVKPIRKSIDQNVEHGSGIVGNKLKVGQKYDFGQRKIRKYQQSNHVVASKTSSPYILNVNSQQANNCQNTITTASKLSKKTQNVNPPSSSHSQLPISLTNHQSSLNQKTINDSNHILEIPLPQNYNTILSSSHVHDPSSRFHFKRGSVPNLSSLVPMDQKFAANSLHHQPTSGPGPTSVKPSLHLLKTRKLLKNDEYQSSGRQLKGSIQAAEQERIQQQEQAVLDLEKQSKWIDQDQAHESDIFDNRGFQKQGIDDFGGIGSQESQG